MGAEQTGDAADIAATYAEIKKAEEYASVCILPSVGSTRPITNSQSRDSSAFLIQ